jgi:hypothetical protein
MSDDRLLKAIDLLEKRTRDYLRNQARPILRPGMSVNDLVSEWNKSAEKVGQEFITAFDAIVVPVHIRINEANEKRLLCLLDSLLSNVEQKAQSSMRALAGAKGYENVPKAWRSRINVGNRGIFIEYSEELKTSVGTANLNVENRKAEERKLSKQYWWRKILDYALRGIGLYQLFQWFLNWVYSKP